MTDLKLSGLEPYRNPKGWVEFWVGLVVLIIFTGLCGRIIYMEELVKRGDTEMRLKYNKPVIEKIDKGHD